MLPIFCWTFYFWSKSRVTKKDRESRLANAMKSSFVYRYRGFNCRKKQFSRSYRNNLNSAWKKINAACLPFITNVCSFPRRLSVCFRGVQNASTETQFNVLRYDSELGRERGGGNGDEAGYDHSRGYAIFFFLSRVMFSFPRCVCYSTVKEYRFCTSQWVRDN